MIDILYYIFVFPLEIVLGFFLNLFYKISASYGISIILLSLCVNFTLLKLTRLSEKKAAQIAIVKAYCDTKIAEFKRVFKGSQLQAYINTLYKQRHYHPLFAILGLGALAVQVPFFIAIWSLFSKFDGIVGTKFLWIENLSTPDSLLGIHLLPILMSLFTLINVFISTKEKGTKIQGILIALIFLVLLYNMSSALVLYWTTNMAFSLVRGIFMKVKELFIQYKSKSQSQSTSCYVECDKVSQKANKNSLSAIRDDKLETNRFFVFQRPLKIVLIALSAILAVGLCLTFVLMIYAKDNLQTSPMTFNSSNKARIHFTKWDFLLRSITIAKIEIVSIEWDNAINSHDISNVKHNGGRYLSFSSTKKLDLVKNTSLGQISYTMNFTPLLKNLLRYYFIILSMVFWIYLLICAINTFQRYEPQYDKIYHNISIYAIVCIAFLICVFTPYQLYNTDITQFDSSQTYFVLSALFGVFIFISFVMIYAISFIPKRFSNIIAFVFSLILFIGLVYSFILVGDYGAMDHFVLQKAPTQNTKQIFEFIIAVLLGSTFVIFMLKKLLRVWQIILLTLFIVSSVNATSIISKRIDSDKITQKSQNDEFKAPYEDELFSYSKTEKNIVVIVLDMFSGSHTPYILEQFPQFKEQLDGFTLFPNALSTTEATAHSIATIIGGEYYAVYNMNTRKQNLAQGIGEAYFNIGNTFVNNGFNVGLIVATGDISMLESNDKIFTTKTWSGDFMDYYIRNGVFSADNNTTKEGYTPKDDRSLDENQNPFDDIVKVKRYALKEDITKFLSFGLFKSAPKTFRTKIYKLLSFNSGISNAIFSIKLSSSTYAATHILNANSTKPTFKFLHTDMTHAPYGMYFSDNKCEFFNKKTAWNDYPHKVEMSVKTNWGDYLYQHYDAESCALKYLADYIENLKRLEIYDNTQIFVVSDHADEDSIRIPKFANKSSMRTGDVLFLFKDFGAKGALKIDKRLIANYDIPSIFCANLKSGCPNVPPNILKNYPQNREIIFTIPYYWMLEQHKPNEWLIEKAYKVKGSIYKPSNWTDISDEKHGIVNVKE